tara:strand:- start:495 stop:614 length:120 start_codon:yes stop_codon:yes gene_type:complete
MLLRREKAVSVKELNPKTFAHIVRDGAFPSQKKDKIYFK